MLICVKQRMQNIANRTRKKKNNFNIKKKYEMWDAFDKEIEESKEVEVVYDSKKRDLCDLCDSILEYNEENFLTCTNSKCGKIQSDSLDYSPEWRYYGCNDNQPVNPTRCGMPINPLLRESSFGCQVACGNRSSYEMRKIRRYTEWQSMPYKEKSQYDEFERIKTMASNSGLPKIIIDAALHFHKKISEEKTFRGLNRDGIIAASIYISCRINNFPRTAKELAVIFHLDTTSATKGCKNAMVILNDIEHQDGTQDKIKLCKTTPHDFIERYCSRLNFNDYFTKICQFVALKIEKEHYIPENTPHSVAAGIIYFISDLCKLNVSKRDVHKVSEISEVTINKCYKKLDHIREKIVPPRLLEQYV